MFLTSVFLQNSKYLRFWVFLVARSNTYTWATGSTYRMTRNVCYRYNPSWNMIYIWQMYQNGTGDSHSISTFVKGCTNFIILAWRHMFLFLECTMSWMAICSDSDARVWFKSSMALSGMPPLGDASPYIPYAGSPTIGWPMAAQCTLNWWVRPVMGVSASRVTGSSVSISVSRDNTVNSVILGFGCLRRIFFHPWCCKSCTTWAASYSDCEDFRFIH